MDEKTIARFWKNVDKRSGNECWTWTGFRRKDNGHGQIVVNRCGRNVGTRVQLVSWAIAHGEWPQKRVEVHCGNQVCVNPLHLMLHQNKVKLSPVAKQRQRHSPIMVTLRCKQCGSSFERSATLARRGLRFCSVTCSALGRVPPFFAGNGLTFVLRNSHTSTSTMPITAAVCSVVNSNPNAAPSTIAWRTIAV